MRLRPIGPRRAMPRFFFHFHDGISEESDREGVVLANRASAATEGWRAVLMLVEEDDGAFDWSASLLTPGLLAALAERVRSPPEDGGLWSGPKVAVWMARHLGLAKVHPQRGWEALKRIGWSVQAPRPRHARPATPDQQADFRRGSR